MVTARGVLEDAKCHQLGARNGPDCAKVTNVMTSRPSGLFEGTGMPDPGWWEALWPDPAKVIRDVGVRPGMMVVDLCSGDGWFTLRLAKIAKSVIAIDIDEKLVKTSQV